jgi:hypothetical protein
MATYHVVCHECREEAILDEQTAAETMVEAHREETGHRMSVGSFSVPNV